MEIASLRTEASPVHPSSSNEDAKTVVPKINFPCQQITICYDAQSRMCDPAAWQPLNPPDHTSGWTQFSEIVIY